MDVGFQAIQQRDLSPLAKDLHGSMYSVCRIQSPYRKPMLQIIEIIVDVKV